MHGHVRPSSLQRLEYHRLITILLVAVAAALVLSIGPTAARSATYRVMQQGGGDEVSINDVFWNNDLEPGDVVCVHRGVYQETISPNGDDAGEVLLAATFDEGISLAGGNRVVLPQGASYTAALVALADDSTNAYVYVYRSWSSNNGAFLVSSVQVAERTVTVIPDIPFISEQSDGSDSHLTIMIVRPVIIRNCDAIPEQVVVRLAEGNDTMAYFESSSYVMVEGMHFDGANRIGDIMGIQVRRSDGNVIRGCSVRDINPDNQGAGILIEGTAHDTAHYNMVLGNVLINAGHEAIYNGDGGSGAAANHSWYTNIVDNEIYHDAPQGASGQLDNAIEAKEFNRGVTIEGNYIHDLSSYWGYGGIIAAGNNAEGATEVLIYNNRIINVFNNSVTGDESYGIDLQGAAKNVYVFNNVVAASTSGTNKKLIGIHVDPLADSSGEVVIANNTLYGLDHGLAAEGSGVLGAHVLCLNNLFASTAGNRHLRGTIVSKNYNLYDSDPMTTIGAQSLIALPLFDSTDPSSSGFLRLAPTSSGIDQGTYLSFFYSDANGTERPQGPAWDIGAYERIVEIFNDGFESGGMSRWSSFSPKI